MTVTEPLVCGVIECFREETAMSQLSTTFEEGNDRQREIAEARSQLAEMAEQQGVRPIGDGVELCGSALPDDVGDDDVNGLLRFLRQWQAEDLTKGGE